MKLTFNLSRKLRTEYFFSTGIALPREYCLLAHPGELDQDLRGMLLPLMFLWDGDDVRLVTAQFARAGERSKAPTNDEAVSFTKWECNDPQCLVDVPYTVRLWHQDFMMSVSTLDEIRKELALKGLSVPEKPAPSIKIDRETRELIFGKKK